MLYICTQRIYYNISIEQVVTERAELVVRFNLFENSTQQVSGGDAQSQLCELSAQPLHFIDTQAYSVNVYIYTFTEREKEKFIK